MTWISRLRAVKPRYFLIALLCIQFALGVLYTFATPLWDGHEADYYTVIRFLDQHGRLPTPEDYPAGDAEIRQATQPPLYFLVAYPVVALLDDAQPVPPGIQPDMVCVGGAAANTPVLHYPITAAYLPPVSGAVAAGYGLRLLNVLLGLAATSLTYLTGRVLFPSRPALALIAVALLAFEANMTSLFSEISNDTLLVTLSAANLLIAAHLARRFTWKLMALLLVTVGLALLTRLPGWALLAFDIPFVLLVGVFQWRASLRARARTILLAVGVLLLAALAVLLFNQVTYGNVLGRYSGLGAMITSALHGFNLPWVTVVGVANFTYAVYELPLQNLAPRAAFLRGYELLVLIGFVGIVWVLARAVYRRKRGDLRPFLVLCGMVLTAVLLVIFRNALASNPENTTLYNTGVLFAPIRYYATGLPAFALLLSAGLMSLIPARFDLSRFNLLGAGVAGCWLVVTLLGGILLLREKPVNPVISPADYAAETGLTTLQTEQPASAPKVLAYRMTEQPTDGLVDLTLYLSTDRALALNHFAQIDMVTAEGRLLNRCQFIPTRGVYPTTLWQPGEIVTAYAELPNCAEPMDVPAELRLRWYGANPNGEVVSASDSELPLGSVSAGMGIAVTCPGNLGIVADSYQITRFNSPESVRIGEPYLPSVNWVVLEPSPQAVARTFTFTHEPSGTQYTCTGSPAPQAYDVRIWRRGEEVFFDACSFTFPSDAPTGTYRVEVGIADAAQQYLPAANGRGEPFPNGLVTVGEVTLAG